MRETEILKQNDKKFDEDIINIFNVIMRSKNNISIDTNNIKKSELNKLQLAFLDSYSKNNLFEIEVNKKYKDLIERYSMTMDLIKKIASQFDDNGINYTYFKTIKPFKHTPNDLDIILYDQNDMKNAYTLLKKQNWIALDNDRYGITLYDKYLDINIDLHLEIMVSNLIYLDKKILIKNVMDYYIDESLIRTLNYEAELITIISHSCYKEHMITLADILNSIYLLKKSNPDVLKRLVIETNISESYKIFQSYLKKLLDLLNYQINKLNINNDENLFLTDLSKIITMPVKLNKNTIFYLMLKKIYNDNYTRASLLRALKESVNTEQIYNIIMHFRRETY